MTGFCSVVHVFYKVLSQDVLAKIEREKKMNNVSQNVPALTVSCQNSINQSNYYIYNPYILSLHNLFG